MSILHDIQGASFRDAARLGRIEKVKRYLAEGLPIDSVDPDGNTALLLAMKHGYIDCAAYLINKGARLTTRNKAGYDVLHYAAEHGRCDVIPAAIRAGLDINRQYGIDRDTPLITAAYRGNHTVVSLLIGLRCDINAVDDHGCCALHWAVRANNKQCVAILIENGADVNIKSKKGNTPLDFAYDEHHDALSATLLNAGAITFRNKCSILCNTQHKIIDQGECTICAASYSVESAAQLSCGHTYHGRCLAIWMTKQHTCPLFSYMDDKTTYVSVVSETNSLAR